MIKWFSALGIIVVDPFFYRQSQCNVKTPSDSVFEAAVHKQRNAVQQLSTSTRTEPNFLTSESFPWLWGVSKCVWHQSSASNASNSESSKIFSFLPLCRSSTSKWLLLKRRNHSRHVLSLWATSPYVHKSIRWASAEIFFKFRYVDRCPSLLCEIFDLPISTSTYSTNYVSQNGGSKVINLILVIQTLKFCGLV